jgi:hypothetical protein
MEAVLRGERPDAMAYFGDMGYWYSAHEKIGDLPPRWRGPDGIRALHKELNIGRYIPGCVVWDVVEGEDIRLEVTNDGRKIVRRWHTPVGAIQEAQQYSEVSFSWAYTEHAVKSVQDLKVVREIYRRRRYRPDPQRIMSEDRLYAEDGHGPTHIGAPATPISELNKHWIGVMDTAYLLADEPEEFHKTLDAIARSHDQVYRIIADSPGYVIMICENLSATTMGSYFDRYIAPHLLRWTSLLHGSGMKVMLHNDGTLRGTLQKLAAVGVDCVDAVTPAPVGDVAIGDLRALAGDRLLLLGGLPGAMFARPFTARDMERHVREIIRVHKDSGAFMFGVADQVPPDGDLNLVRLVADLIEQYGRYD